MVYTVQQVAEILRVNPETVRRLCDKGKIKFFRVGRRVRIEKTELDDFIQRQKTS